MKTIIAVFIIIAIIAVIRHFRKKKSPVTPNCVICDGHGCLFCQWTGGAPKG